jgi:GTPase SAR1 family protein
MKIVIVGDEGVGKRKLIEEKDAFQESYYLTHGFQPYLTGRKVEDREVRFQSWILNPKSGFDDVRKTYYKGSLGAIIIFDIAKPETFDSVDKYIHEIWENADIDIPIIIMGNQKDNGETNIHLTNKVYGYVKDLMEKEEEGVITIRYVENSTKNNSGFEEALQHLGIEYFYYLERKKNEASQ